MPAASEPAPAAGPPTAKPTTRRIAPQPVSPPAAAAGGGAPQPFAYAAECIFTPAALRAIHSRAKPRARALHASPRFTTPDGGRLLPPGVQSALRLAIDHPAWWQRNSPLRVAPAPRGHRLLAASWVNEFKPAASARMVVAARRVKQGSLLGVYVSKVLSQEETDARQPPPGLHGYIFDFGWDDLTFDASEVRNAVPEIVDAREFGGKRNGEVPSVPRGAVNMCFTRIEDREEGRRYIIAIATHGIAAGQEIKCDYQAGSSTYWENLWETMEANRRAADGEASRSGSDAASDESGGSERGPAVAAMTRQVVEAAAKQAAVEELLQVRAEIARLKAQLGEAELELEAERCARRDAEARREEAERRAAEAGGRRASAARRAGHGRK